MLAFGAYSHKFSAISVRLVRKFRSKFDQMQAKHRRLDDFWRVFVRKRVVNPKKWRIKHDFGPFSSPK